MSAAIRAQITKSSKSLKTALDKHATNSFECLVDAAQSDIDNHRRLTRESKLLELDLK